MSHGSSSNDKCEPNFTPLLDLVLQLVMFFMLCANFIMDQTNVEIKLPEAIAAKALDPNARGAIYLNVNEKGEVLLAPVDQFTDSTGTRTDKLENADRVRNFLKRRAKEDLDRIEAEEKRKNPNVQLPLPEALVQEQRSVLILRVDARCAFEKTYEIMQACRAAGYNNVQLRAKRYSGTES